MTRDEARPLWAILLAEYGAQVLEEKILIALETLLSVNLAEELPQQVSAEGMAQFSGAIAGKY